MKRKISSCLRLGVILFFAFFVPVFAAGVDTEKLGSLEIKYRYESVPMTSTTVTLYKIGTIDARGIYSYIGRYLTWSKPINNLTASEVRELSKELLDYIIEEKIEFDFQEKTDTLGDVSFKEVPTGLYLIQTDTYEVDNRSYQVAPTLVAIPQEGKDGEYIYDVEIDGKIEMIDHNPTHSGNDNTTESPSTYDEIYVYVGVLILSIVILVVLVLLYIIKKKGSNKK